MQKAKTTIQARLKVKGEEKKILDDLMRRWSSCMRYAYRRLLEGKTRNELKKELQKLFNLNSRYVDQEAGKSLQRESGTVSLSTEGRNRNTAGKVETCPYNLWRVLRTAVLTALSSEGLPRSLSPLKPLLVSGNIGKT